jgi:formamidopyrimidine-DNA glycosylase
MPEGPEIWKLSKSINDFYNNSNTTSYGKHLFILDKKENWSFGLTGKVSINESNELIKINSGWLNGEITSYIDYNDSISNLGTDFMTSEEHLIRQEIDKWKKSKKKLGGMLLDQSKISGIGVAWGSEILFHCNLRPDLKCCDQDTSLLADSYFYIREKILEIYNDDLKINVNEWFDNLYEVRNMKIYKKGTKIDVLGRNWWI